MCGFAGQIGSPISNKFHLLEILLSISHRGPDDNGLYKDDHSTFIHNRLSLIDTSINGHQPFEDDFHVLLFNGEIYNHLELRKRLLSDSSFKSSSDTETLFQLLKKFDIKHICSLLEGMFSFCWYDKKTIEIWIARDRLGIKPLFFSNKSGGFQFASEIKALLSFNKYSVNVPKVMCAAFGELEFSRLHTAFDGIYQLEPGNIVHFRKNNSDFTISEYFTLSDAVNENEYNRLHQSNDAELLEEFECHFHQSIKKMLVADVPMGAFVSGGIDSSLIATIASQYKKLDLFTANVTGKYSELKYSEMLATSINSPLYVHNYQPNDFVLALAKTTWHYEAPLVVHANAIPFQRTASLAKSKRVKAVLTGEGADELFLGYPRLLTRKLDKFLKAPYNITNGIYKRFPGLTRYLNLNHHNFQRDTLFLPYGYEREKNNQSYENAFSFVQSPSKRRDHILSLEMLGRSLHSLLWRNDRMGMMHSIEARFPFLDEQILKFAINLPIHQKISLTSRFHNFKHPFLIDKYIIRKLGERYLPKELVYRKKAGFQTYGLLNMQIKKGFFDNGFIAECFQLSKNGIQQFEASADPYLKAKMACVEIWGQLFVRQKKIQEVSASAIKHISITP